MLVIAVLTFVVLEPWIRLHMRLLVSWNLGAITYLALAWTTVSLADPLMTRVRAQSHDQNGYVIFVLVLTAASASFVAIGFLVGDMHSLPLEQRMIHLTLSISALLLSWLLIQTLSLFTTRAGTTRAPGESRIAAAALSRRSRSDYLDFALRVRGRHDVAGVRRPGDDAADAPPHAGARRAGVHLQHRAPGSSASRGTVDAAGQRWCAVPYAQPATACGIDFVALEPRAGGVSGKSPRARIKLLAIS
jgi:hypothetical protein